MQEWLAASLPLLPILNQAVAAGKRLRLLPWHHGAIALTAGSVCVPRCTDMMCHLSEGAPGCFVLKWEGESGCCAAVLAARMLKLLVASCKV